MRTIHLRFSNRKRNKVFIAGDLFSRFNYLHVRLTEMHNTDCKGKAVKAF